MSGEWKVLSVAITIAYALVYTAGYLVLTLFTLGAGHGSAVLLSALPTWLIFLACVVMTFWAEKKDIRFGILILMFFNYAITLSLFLVMEMRDGFEHSIKYFRMHPEALVLSVGWYAAGQVIFWFLFLKKRSRALP